MTSKKLVLTETRILSSIVLNSLLLLFDSSFWNFVSNINVKFASLRISPENETKSFINSYQVKVKSFLQVSWARKTINLCKIAFLFFFFYALDSWLNLSNGARFYFLWRSDCVNQQYVNTCLPRQSLEKSVELYLPSCKVLTTRMFPGSPWPFSLNPLTLTSYEVWKSSLPITVSVMLLVTFRSLYNCDPRRLYCIR